MTKYLLKPAIEMESATVPSIDCTACHTPLGMRSPSPALRLTVVHSTPREEEEDDEEEDDDDDDEEEEEELAVSSANGFSAELFLSSALIFIFVSSRGRASFTVLLPVKTIKSEVVSSLCVQHVDPCVPVKNS